MDRHLHIITHDVPHTGNADLFTSVNVKVKALKNAGVKVHLHCFANENSRKSSLEGACHSVHYYNLHKLSKWRLGFLPYTLFQRSSAELINRLNMDDHPVIFEGLKTVFPLLNNQLVKKRKTLVRIHRIESRYYWDLGKIRHVGLQKMALLFESFLFRKLESRIAELSAIAVSTEKLLDHIKKIAPRSMVHLITGFTGIPASFYQEGQGGFCLYHGDLSKRENEYAAMWLLEHVFNQIEIPFVIAGYAPSKNLENAAHLRLHTCLVADPGEKEMLDLIKKAQINLLPSFITSDNVGLLLRSFAVGKHVLTNLKAISDREMESVCEVAGTPNEFIESIRRLFLEEFKKETFERREAYLNRIYRDTQNMEELLRLLY